VFFGPVLLIAFGFSSRFISSCGNGRARDMGDKQVAKWLNICGALPPLTAVYVFHQHPILDISPKIRRLGQKEIQLDRGGANRETIISLNMSSTLNGPVSQRTSETITSDMPVNAPVTAE
jgi:hypothetical protein